MKAFWWFDEGSIAGHARPGFNSIHWFDLPFDEASVVGWLGTYSSGEAPLESLRHHLRTYVPKIFPFYKIDPEAGAKAIENLNSEAGLTDALERLTKRTGMLDRFSVSDDRLHFVLSEDHLNADAVFLKSQGIRHVVSLTEKHHGREVLSQHFQTHHIGIEDLGAPKLEQVERFAELLTAAKTGDEKLSVHCLAGIGRTSTMLLGAHLLLGHKFDDLQTRIARQNPKFKLSGSQGDFLKSLAIQRELVD